MTTYDEVRVALDPFDAHDTAKDEAAAAACELLTRRRYSRAEVDVHIARELEESGVIIDPDRVSLLSVVYDRSVSGRGTTRTITLELEVR